jgi:hypothetical protein
MMQPFPAASGSVDPAYGSPVSLNRRSACAVVVPMSKQTPVLLM